MTNSTRDIGEQTHKKESKWNYNKQSKWNCEMDANLVLRCMKCCNAWSAGTKTEMKHTVGEMLTKIKHIVQEQTMPKYSAGMKVIAHE